MAHIVERIVEAIQAERLVDNTGDASDVGYNEGIAAALAAVREVAAEHTAERRNVDLFQIIDRAREVLGRKEG